MANQRREKCFFCKGHLKKKKVTVDYWWKGTLVLIEKVPALVCSQCGEEVFEGPVAERLDQIAKERGRAKTIPVSVKQFHELLASA